MIQRKQQHKNNLLHTLLKLSRSRLHRYSRCSFTQASLFMKLKSRSASKAIFLYNSVTDYF